MEVAGRGDLQVVRARDRKVDLDAAGETRNHRSNVGELKRLERLRPARRLPEQVVELSGLSGRVSALLGFDSKLNPQRDGMNAFSGGLRNPQLEYERRTGGIGIGADVIAVEDELRHRSTPSSSGSDDSATVPARRSR